MKDPKQRSRTPVNSFVARRIREIRMQKGITCRDMAGKTGIPSSSYSCLEHGWYKINLDNLFRILQALGAELREVWPQVKARPGQVLRGEDIEQAVRLSDQERPSGPGLEDLLEAVCGAFRVTPELLRGAHRWGRLQEARAACALLSAELPDVTFSALAPWLGMKASSLSRLARRHRRQSREDPHFAGALQSAREALAPAAA